jgi:hypothetical protein
MTKIQGFYPTSLLYLMPAMIVVAWISGASHALGQTAGCTLVHDDRHPKEQILRCGGGLTIRSAADTKFRTTGQTDLSPPTGVRLESGALLIEFTPGERRKDFQILTPHAIAAVRGTRWAVEVVRTRTSTLVLEGAVEVSHVRERPSGALLRAGEGADVTAKPGPIQVKRWAKKRVDALLARFGQ